MPLKVVPPVLVLLVLLAVANNWLGARDLYSSLAERLAGKVASDYQEEFTPTPAPSPQ
jgi:hypothetical protein